MSSRFLLLSLLAQLHSAYKYNMNITDRDMHSTDQREMENKPNNNFDLDECRDRRRRRRIIRGLSSSPPPHLLSLRPTFGLASHLLPQMHYTPIDLNSHFSSSSSSSSGKQKSIQLFPVDTVSPPVYGYLSLAGRTLDMEDTLSVNLNLCSPSINRRRPVHFFGVYDGHGGAHVSALCKGMMHVLMREELMRVDITGMGASGVCSRKGKEKQVELEMPWKNAIRKCFERMDEAALSYCLCGNSVGQCICHPMELSLTGSTAVVAMLTPDQVIVANCGDSRAVLCRAGKCIPLSFDHKPDRVDELARITAAGGKVYNSNGVRVQGILAMSRAIGDKFLKKVITSEPEIRFMKRHKDDECMILASDGLWDVVSSELACEMASNCLRQGILNAGMGEGLLNFGMGENNCQPVINSEGTGFIYPSTCASAATVITRLALGRNSCDNISVVVVDLRR